MLCNYIPIHYIKLECIHLRELIRINFLSAYGYFSILIASLRNEINYLNHPIYDDWIRRR